MQKPGSQTENVLLAGQELTQEQPIDGLHSEYVTNFAVLGEGSSGSRYFKIV